LPSGVGLTQFVTRDMKIRYRTNKQRSISLVSSNMIAAICLNQSNHGYGFALHSDAGECDSELEVVQLVPIPAIQRVPEYSRAFMPAARHSGVTKLFG
jgi:hypothetical protein